MGTGFDRYGFGLLAFARTLQAPLLGIEVMAQPLDVADVIKNHRLFAGLGPKAAANHLQMQGQAHGGPQQQTTRNRGHINPLADEAATGEHQQLTAGQLGQERAPLERVHGAID